MKQIVFLSLLLAFVITSFAQEKINLFVRVYNLAGEKINKGHVIRVTDTTLQLKAKSSSVDIPVGGIGYIKTKRSAGHNVLIGSLIGATTGAALGAITGESSESSNPGFSSKAGLAVIDGIIGLGVGAAIGGLTVLAKNPHTYLINGDISEWKTFQSMINERSN